MTSFKQQLGASDAPPLPKQVPSGDGAGLDGESLARRLEQFSSFRVLRALELDAGLSSLGAIKFDERIAVVVDSETTGLDATQDRMGEIAAQRFCFDATGGIRAIERVRSWLEDPGRAMPERLVALTGLTDDMLAGQRFNDDAVLSILSSADLIIAHNAAFDRPFFDNRFPNLRESRWACSMTQLDWADHGFDGRALGHLVMQCGWYFEGHRAAADVRALTTLLGHNARDERTLFAHLLDASNSETIRIEAIGAPFNAKNTLKQRGYRWDRNGQFWCCEATSQTASEELSWLDSHVYFGRGTPNTRTVTARERFILQP